MLDGDTIRNFLDGTGSAVLDIAINLGGELGEFERILIVFIAPAAGVIISLWAVRDVLKFRDPKTSNPPSPMSIITRLAIGPLMIQLSAFVATMSRSIFGDGVQEKEDLAMTYANRAETTGDPLAAGILVIVAFLVFVGWITALRSLISFARIGTAGEDGFKLFREGLSRLIVAAIFTSLPIFMDGMIASATGEAEVFSSGFGFD